MGYEFMSMVDSMDSDQFSAALAYMVWQGAKREEAGENVVRGTYDQITILQMIAEDRACAH